MIAYISISLCFLRFIIVTFPLRFLVTAVFVVVVVVVSSISYRFLHFQSNAVLLLDTTGSAIRRLVLPTEEFTSKKSSWWSKEEGVRNTRFA
jgi:hypothetical protein